MGILYFPFWGQSRRGETEILESDTNSCPKKFVSSIIFKVGQCSLDLSEFEGKNLKKELGIEGKKVVLYVSRIARLKGLDILIKSIKKLEGENHHLLVTLRKLIEDDQLREEMGKKLIEDDQKMTNSKEEYEPL